MEGSLDVELISRETIKPSQPTPPHLKDYLLSCIDNLSFNTYVPIVFFYSPPDQPCDHTSRVSRLKNSLSQALSIYYPFAGRFTDEYSIDCSDQGVLLLVTRVKAKLTHILHNPNESLLSPLFPEELHWKSLPSRESALLVIQINGFDCGGMAISMCLSHKAGDAATMFNFINDWAIINRGEPSDEINLPLPVLDVGTSVYPQKGLPIFPDYKYTDNTVCKRFVFEGSAIESLKAMVSSQNVPNPTRVEVISALIYKCIASALGLSFGSMSYVSFVNIRKRMEPPLVEKSVGNLLGCLLMVSPFVDKKEIGLGDMVRKIKRGLSEFCAKNFEGKDRKVFVSSCIQLANMFKMTRGMSNARVVRFSSWIGFPIYQVDFGWGKPIWVTIYCCPLEYLVFLMDTRDGKGIEAIVNMKEQDLAKFEHHAELLQYASLLQTITC